jgi:hypothetical protein
MTSTLTSAVQPTTTIQRPALARASATACTVAVGVFVALVALLHVIEPQFNPMWRFVSEYSNGPYGMLMKLAFFIMAFGCAAAFVAIRPHVETKPARIGLFFLALSVIGLVMAGLFNQDAITSTVATREGNLHAIATILGIPGFVLASLFLGSSLARRWTAVRTPLVVLSQLPWISFVSMPVYMAIVMPDAGGFGPTVWVGLINRIFLVVMCSWLVFVAWHAKRA